MTSRKLGRSLVYFCREGISRCMHNEQTFRLTGSHDGQGHQHFFHGYSAMLVGVLEIIDIIIVIVGVDEKVMRKGKDIF